MKKIHYILAAIVLTAFTTSCNRLTPFTKSIYEDNAWTQADLGKIQFYLSQDVVLYRKLKNTDTKITSGKILTKDGRQVEEIIIKRRTPGIFEFQKDDTENFAVSFDVDGRYLIFGPNPKMNNKYTLRGKSWKKQGRGTVMYGEDEFELAPGSGYAGLLVNMKKMQNTSIKSRKAKGRTVN